MKEQVLSNIRLILEYEDIFDENPNEIYSYLDGIDKWILIRSAIFYCSLSTKLEPELNYLFYPFLTEKDRGTSFEEKLKEKTIEFIDKHKGVNPIVINVRTSLRFFELIQSYDSKKKIELSQEKINKRLLKVYLLLNQKNNYEFGQRENYNEIIIANSLLYSIYSDTNLVYLRIAELIKACLFLEYCELSIPVHYSKFLSESGVLNWQEYVTYIHQIGMLFVNKNIDSPMPIVEVPKNDEVYEKKVAFLDKFCLTEIYQNDADYTKIKVNPVIKNYETGEYYIIFEQFFVEKMYKCLYFTFNAINSELKGKKEYVKDFKGDIGKYFSEKILLNKIIKDAIGKKYKHLGYSELQKEGRPDYYIRNGKNIFLFECKDNLIKKSVIESANIDQFISELDHIFIKSKDGQRKAIRQLIYNIKDIREGDFEEDKEINPTKNIIYPIIVTNNTIFSLAGMNLLINEWFFNELKICNIDIQGIKNLTLININTLILLQGLLSNNHFRIKALIDTYWQECNSLNNRKYPTEEVVMSKRFEVSMSFDKYIEGKISGRNIFTSVIRQYRRYFEKET